MYTVAHIGEFDLKVPTGTGMAVQGIASATGEEFKHVIFNLSGGEATDDILRDASSRLRLLANGEAVLRRAGIDVLHMHGAFVPDLRFIAMRAKLPYVVSTHGGYLPEVFERDRTTMKRAYFQYWERKYLRRSSSLLTLTRREAQRMLALTGVPAVVLPNVIDGDQADRIAARRTGSAGLDGPVLFLGRGDVFNKGLDRFFDIAAELDGYEFHAHVAARGTYEEQLEVLVTRATSNAYLRDPVYGKEKEDVLSRARAYLHLARWEAFGMSIVEAAAAGVPVIVSSEIALANQIQEHGAGLVVDPCPRTLVARVGEFLADESALREAGGKARQWARESFSPEAMSTRVELIYRKALRVGR